MSILILVSIILISTQVQSHSLTFGGSVNVKSEATGQWSNWSPWWVMYNAPTYNIQVSLNKNWNIISFPINQIIDKYTLTVKCNNISYSWNNAVTEEIIIDFIYGWDNMYCLSDCFEPGKGYWVYAYQECSLLF